MTASLDPTPTESDDAATQIAEIGTAPIEEAAPVLCHICQQPAGGEDCHVIDGQPLCFSCFYAEHGGE